MRIQRLKGKASGKASGGEGRSTAQDSRATNMGSQKEENSHHTTPRCTTFSSFHTSKNYTDKQEPNQKTNKTV